MKLVRQRLIENDLLVSWFTLWFDGPHGPEIAIDPKQSHFASTVLFVFCHSLLNENQAMDRTVAGVVAG